MFRLDTRLQKDTYLLGDFPLCRLLLMNDQTYPWVILVPRRAEISEIHHLNNADQQQLWRESARVASWLEEQFSYDSLNVAALGNVVSQLHLHQVCRSVGDPTWPGPVWGAKPPVSYRSEQVADIRKLTAGLADSELAFDPAD